jgi:hypothetical protein
MPLHRASLSAWSSRAFFSVAPTRAPISLAFYVVTTPKQLPPSFYLCYYNYYYYCYYYYLPSTLATLMLPPKWLAAGSATHMWPTRP